MLVNQSIGNYITKFRDVLALKLFNEIVNKINFQELQIDIERTSLLDNCYRDISKLFLAIVSERPAIFGNYIEWQKSVYTNRSISISIILKQIEIFKDVMLSNTPDDMHDIISDYITSGIDALTKQVCQDNINDKYLYVQTDYAKKYLEFVLENKKDEAIDFILELVRKRVALKEIYIDIIQPVQYEIGLLWQKNNISVTKEHNATEITKLALSQLYPYLKKVKKHDFSIVSTCVGNELHEIGIRIVSDYFALNGWKTYHIGCNAPINSVSRLLNEADANILAISATMSNEIFLVKKLIEQVKERGFTNLKIIVGGNIFNMNPKLVELVGADGYGKDAIEGLEIANELVGNN